MNLFTKALIVSVVVSCHLSLASATVIDEISMTSIDTVYEWTPDVNGTGTGKLTIEQVGLVMILEMSDNTQDAKTGVIFSLVTFLEEDLSTNTQAIADLSLNGSIIITNADDSETYLTADLVSFDIEENLNASDYELSGSGDFIITGGTLANQFGPAGVIFDVTWNLPSEIEDFTESFTAESNVTLTPEPATMVLLAAGGLLSMTRRRRHNC
jgi:hypothetical protein